MIGLLVLIFANLGHLIIGLLTLLKNQRSATNILFGILLFNIILWTTASYLSINLSDSNSTLAYARIVLFFAASQNFLIFLFVYTFPRKNILLGKSILFLLSLFTLSVMALVLSPFVFSGIRIDPITNQSAPVVQPGIVLFAINTAGFLGAAIFKLFQKFHHSRGFEREQLRYLLLGFLTTFSLIVLTNFILVVIFGVTFFVNYAPAFTLILAATTSYAIVKHHLFDIRIIIKRTVVYSALLAFVLSTYAAVLFLFSSLFGGEVVPLPTTSALITNLLAAILIAFGFGPLNKWLSNFTDKFLFRGEYDSDEVVQRLNNALASVVDLDEAAMTMMQEATAAFRIRLAATFILQNLDHATSVRRIKSLGYLNPTNLQLPSNSPLFQFFADNPKIVITEELERRCENARDTFAQTCAPIVEVLKRFKAAVAMPIVIQAQTKGNGIEENKLIGIVLFGEKLSGDIFSTQDRNLLEIIASQTATAVQKARFYEEDQLKSEFVSIASHELLTPTAAIEGYLSMILEEGMGKVDVKAKSYLTKVYRSSRRLSELVKDLLSVSRIEAGRIVIDKQPFDLVEVITGAVDDLAVTAQQKGIKLTFEKPKGALGQAFGDAQKATQVMVNLIGNSIKYNRPKGGWVKLDVSRQNHELLVRVQDSGIGIKKEEQKHLFEKFYRTEDVMTSEHQGTGLGLFITKNLIELMGGKIGMESEFGKGSTFFFTLPVATGEEKHMISGDPKLMTLDQRALVEKSEETQNAPAPTQPTEHTQ